MQKRKTTRAERAAKRDSAKVLAEGRQKLIRQRIADRRKQQIEIEAAPRDEQMQDVADAQAEKDVKMVYEEAPAVPEGGAASGFADKVLNIPYTVRKAGKPWTARDQYLNEVRAAKARGAIDNDPLGLNYTENIALGYNSRDLEEHASSATSDMNISYEALESFLKRIMPKAKQPQIDKILATNINDALIAFTLGTANVKNVAPGVLANMAARGLDITQACKFGKSKKLYKSVKIPKILFGVRAINPPSPAIFVMRFMSFIWRLLGTGINRPPGSFLRIGMAFVKELGGGNKVVKNPRGRLMQIPFTKTMLISALLKLDALAPGLLSAYSAYQLDSIDMKRLKNEERERNQETRNIAMQLYNESVYDLSTALEGFQGTLATASNMLLPEVVRPMTDATLGPLLSEYTDGPKKGAVMKGGDYRRAIFGGPKTAIKNERKTYTNKGAEEEVKSTTTTTAVPIKP